MAASAPDNCPQKPNSTDMKSTKVRSLFLLIALAIVVASVMFTNNLVNKLADEEKKKIEIWAEATRQLVLADENTDIEFISSIIAGNTTIPVYMTDQDGNFLLSRNVREPKKHVEQFYKNKIAKLRDSQEPIVVRISNNTVQYIYYEDSTLMRSLQWFPYIQFAIILIFVFIVLFALQTSQRSEQNRVWVGLSKETAHQLGTPISSLNAWTALLSAQYPDDELIPKMQQDVDRLQTIAERFSKIGSEPELKYEDVGKLTNDAIEYMRHRTSNKIRYDISCEGDVKSMVSAPLISWVIENLCKNAVDAMEGQGTLSVRVFTNGQRVIIDISDTGKGIEHSLFNAIFDPGYTTKARGWGLGLSLSKRIIEDYHKGKIFVKRSTLGEGTTFRIRLPKATAPLS